jgi:hypothetical protein
MYDFISNLFTNNDNQKIISLILIFLQDIAYFDDLASIKKFTEAAGLFDSDPLYTIFRMISDETLIKFFNSFLRIFYKYI